MHCPLISLTSVTEVNEVEYVGGTSTAKTCSDASYDQKYRLGQDSATAVAVDVCDWTSLLLRCVPLIL